MKDKMEDTYSYKLADIGHNDCVDLGGRTFHVQTEVIPTRPVKIKTTIFQDGAVLDAIQQKLTSAKDDSADVILQMAKIQHENAVRKIREGKYLSVI